MLANDTGPLHLAAALGVPCVAPYLCTRVELHGPFGRDLTPGPLSMNGEGVFKVRPVFGFRSGTSVTDAVPPRARPA